MKRIIMLAVLAAVLAPSLSFAGSSIWCIGKTTPREGLCLDNSENLVVKGSVKATGSFVVDGQVAFSSPPVMHASGFNSTLASGVTFYAFVPDSAITLRRVTATIVVAGTGGSGDSWTASTGAVSGLAATSAAAAAAGSVHSSAGSLSLTAGTTVYLRLQSAASPTPTANVSVEYVVQ